MEIIAGQVATMRKVHACGGYDWKITRTGADIGLKCLKCGRHIMLDRQVFVKRVWRIEPHQSSTEETE